MPVLLSALLVLMPAAGAGPKVTSPDGRTMASAADKTITVADAASQRVLISIAAHKGVVTALAYSPDGKLLASGDGGGGLCLFDAATGKELRRITAAAGVTKLTFSADGRHLEVKMGQKATKYDVATGAEKP